MLQKIKAVFDKEYMKKWKIREDHEYYHLGINGVPINNNIYRDGRFNRFDTTYEFSLVMKGVEDLYSKEITDYTGSTPEHIANIWVAINNNLGEEIIVFKKHESVYLANGSCIAYSGSKYYNLRTKSEYPFRFSESISSSKYLFISEYSSKKVYKIDKETGEYEEFN
jgi:hypothetical protein